MTIVLKDRNDADVVFTYTGTTGNGVIFDNRSSTLIGRKRLTLSLNENTNTNRIGVKLSIPSICQGEDACDKATVKYTQVASADISVVRFASLEDREDLAAMFASLIGSSDLELLVTDGVLPQS